MHSILQLSKLGKRWLISYPLDRFIEDRKIYDKCSETVDLIYTLWDPLMPKKTWAHRQGEMANWYEFWGEDEAVEYLRWRMQNAGQAIAARALDLKFICLC